MDNDFHRTHDIFALFEGLEVPNMDTVATAEPFMNRHNGASGPFVNGEHKPSSNGLLN